MSQNNKWKKISNSYKLIFFSVRRLLHDDAFGVGEALNETAFGEGLVVRGKHR